MKNNMIEMINFSKGDNNLLPTIAQDYKTKEILMLAYMNKDALKATLESGFAHYWSRSRKKLWMKGETSGNTQKVIEIKVDCDFDSILVIVDQKGPACHNETYTCFTTKLL